MHLVRRESHRHQCGSPGICPLLVPKYSRWYGGTATSKIVPTANLFRIEQTELEREKSRKDSGDSAWIERTRQTEAELDWAKEMADRLDRVNQGLSRENMRLKSQFKSQEDDRKFLIRQLVAVKVLYVLYICTTVLEKHQLDLVIFEQWLPPPYFLVILFYWMRTSRKPKCVLYAVTSIFSLCNFHWMLIRTAARIRT